MQAPSTSQAATMGSVGGPSGGQPRPQQPPVAQPHKDPIVSNPRQGSLGLLEPSQLPAASSAGVDPACLDQDRACGIRELGLPALVFAVVWIHVQVMVLLQVACLHT